MASGGTESKSKSRVNGSACIEKVIGYHLEINKMSYEDNSGKENDSNYDLLPGTYGDSLPDKVQSSPDTKLVVLYGSQTGTASLMATKFHKEFTNRYNARCILAEISDYRVSNINQLPTDTICIFFIASYGDGEQCDDAVDAYGFFMHPKMQFDNGDNKFKEFRFGMFGLGSSSYEFYQGASRNMRDALVRAGGELISPHGYGEGNDDKGSLDEDYMEWKEEIIPVLGDILGLQEVEDTVGYVPLINVVEISNRDCVRANGEIASSLRDLQFLSRPPYHIYKPFVASVGNAKKLCQVEDGQCLHVEFDISGSKMSYETGDHVGIYPTNPISEIAKFMRVFGLEGKEDHIVRVTQIDRSSGANLVWFPSPATYKAIVGHYLNINKPVSRQLLKSLIQFAPSTEAETLLRQVTDSRKSFTEYQLMNNMDAYNVASTLSSISNTTWLEVPFALLLEQLGKLQPRYYSISSSSLKSPTWVHVTARLEPKPFGICTHNLLDIYQKTADLDDYQSKYEYLNECKLPIFIRKSKFRLPYNKTRPTIMIGPGTGIAPFRGFVQQRLEEVRNGLMDAGQMVLFYGCRSPENDMLYSDEWLRIEGQLNGNFTMFTAFSREENTRTKYVQDLLIENKKLVYDIIMKEGGYVYVCGNVGNGMVKSVKGALREIIGSEGEDANWVMKSMRTSGRYQEDVW